MERKLGRFLAISFIFHFILFGVLVGIHQFESFDDLKPEPIPEAVHVDIVGLPDQVKSEKSDIDLSRSVEEPEKPNSPDTAIPIPKEDIPPPADISSAKKIIERLKAKRELKEKLNKEKEPKEKVVYQDTNARKAIKGNLVSQGNSRNGEVVKLEDVQQWKFAVLAKYKSKWELPESLINSDFRAVAKVHVGEDGQVLNAYIAKKSGNAEFDREVTLVLQSVESLPSPPENLKDDAKKNGLSLYFPIR